MHIYDEPMPWEEEEERRAKARRCPADAFETHMRSLQMQNAQLAREFEVDITATKMTLWERIKLFWRFVW